MKGLNLGSQNLESVAQIWHVAQGELRELAAESKVEPDGEAQVRAHLSMQIPGAQNHWQGRTRGSTFRVLNARGIWKSRPGTSILVGPQASWKQWCGLLLKYNHQPAGALLDKGQKLQQELLWGLRI